MTPTSAQSSYVLAILFSWHIGQLSLPYTGSTFRVTTTHGRLRIAHVHVAKQDARNPPYAECKRGERVKEALTRKSAREGRVGIRAVGGSQMERTSAFPAMAARSCLTCLQN